MPKRVSIAKSTILGMSFGDHLRTWRAKAIDPDTGLPFERPALAEASGIHYKTISALENGTQHTVTPADASKLANALGVTVADVCRAMGYAVETGSLSPEDRDLVAIGRRMPPQIRGQFVESTRQLARGLIAIYRAAGGKG